jgi:hypothetical protein
MRCPILNPIRFYDSAKLPDYSTYYPYGDNQTQREEWVKGLNPMPFYKEFRAGEALALQFEQENTESTTLTAYKYNIYLKAFEVDGTLPALDITPSGWTGDSIFSYSKTFTAGTYYLKFTDNLTSDIFVVTDDSEEIKQLVKVQYGNRENDFGCIFDNDYLFTQFFTGQFLQGDPENEKESFESDRGAMVNLHSVPKRVYTLNINDIHLSYIDHVNLLFSVSEITINGVEVESVEVQNTEKAELSDSANITLKVYVKDFDYFYKR